MHRSLLAFILLLITAAPAFAQLTGSDIASGDACTAGEINRSAVTADADADRRGVVLICDGANWVVEQPTFANACSDGDSVTYDAASGRLACVTACSDNTPNSFNFTDNSTASTSTLTTSNILQITSITCQVSATISGQGSPQYRTCSDSGCSTVVQDWTAASSGVNNNEYIQMRLTTSALGGDTFTPFLTVGNTFDAWNVTPTGSCVGSPVPGTVCPDGTIYAGQSPDGNVAMFTPRCDEGMSWSGTACTGARVSLSWNDGNTSNHVTTLTTSTITGQANTATMDGLDSDSVASPSPHRAAQRCADLNQNGNTDWYLPSTQEAAVLWSNRTAIGNIISVSGYWFSTESSNTQAIWGRLDTGFSGATNKQGSFFIRCVRR